jgi:hypothetical protein
MMEVLVTLGDLTKLVRWDASRARIADSLLAFKHIPGLTIEIVSYTPKKD